MNLFKPATNTQAFAKVGIMGFAGSGKTYTATEFAIGLVEHMRKLELEIGNKPAFFLDTETGSDWITPRFKDAGINLNQAKTRAFKHLIPAVKEAEAEGSILIIDSISHFWRDLTESYQKKLNRKRLQFQDWNVLKQQWGEFTDIFVNSNSHIILCGRAGYEYDYISHDETDKKELTKTGVKMKAETETGYEPSLLILMERHQDMETNKVYRMGHILKDRSTFLDGKEFRDPSFHDFLPHVEFLNLGGSQLGVTTENSEELFDVEGKPDWQKEKMEKEIVLDEIQSLLVKHYPSTKTEDKASKMALLEKHLQSRSWKRIETFSLTILKNAYKAMLDELEPPKLEAVEDLSDQESEVAALG